MKKWMWELCLFFDCVFMFVCLIGISKPGVTGYVRNALYIGCAGLMLCCVFFIVKVVQADAREKHTINISSSRNAQGRAYEQACARRLMREGYTDVRLTPVTGDFGADILATHPDGWKFCFQCKYYSSNVGEDAVQEVISAVHYYHADAGAVLTTADFTPKARELARAANVALMPHYDAHLDWIDRVEGFDAFMN